MKTENQKSLNTAELGNKFKTDVISSIELLKQDMESWKEALIENANDGEKYSDGLLKGYNAAIGQFNNRLGKYCL